MAVTLYFTVPQSNVPVDRVNVYECPCEEATGTGTDPCGRDGCVKVYTESIDETATSVIYPDGDPNGCYRISFTNVDGIEGGLSDLIYGSDPSGVDCYNRISARVGGTVCLNMTFFRNGIPQDPCAIRLIKIYKRSVDEANLVAEIIFPYPNDPAYPTPALRDPGKPGYFNVPFDIPYDFPVPDIYFDVWHYIPDCVDTTDFSYDNEAYWLSQCGRLWVYPDGWSAEDGLIVPKLSFDPLDVQFRAGEKRWLEIGITPLPLYDYDYNTIVPLIPYLKPAIIVKTRNNENIIDGEPMDIGLRQGAYRSNPFAFKWLLDTSRFIKGTYDYQVKVGLPDGQTLVSPNFTFTIS